MQVSVDTTKCQGHGVCVMKSPQVFDLGEDDGLSHVLVEVVSGDLTLAAELAAANCPERAIALEP